MTLPMTTESYARVSRDLITTLICLLAAALIISALARTPETSNTQDPRAIVSGLRQIIPIVPKRVAASLVLMS